MEELKKSFRCKIGLHYFCLDKWISVPVVYGPFDPHPERTEQRVRYVCAKCGQENLVDPYYYDSL